MDPAHLSYLGWLVLGISTGMGPCVAHHTLVMIPYVSIARRHPGVALLEVLAYSSARIVMYLLLGVLAGGTGRLLRDSLAASPLTSLLPLVFGSLLIIISMAALFHRDSVLCKWLHNYLIARRGRTMFVAGLMTALMPCPILLGVIGGAAASGSIMYGGVSAGLFGLGTAIGPPLLLAPLVGLFKARVRTDRLGEIFQFGGAILLFGYGFHLILSQVL